VAIPTAQALLFSRLQRSRGNADDGADLLAGTYARFRESFDTADLRAAADFAPFASLSR
jgi:hypothetical protein